MSVLLVDGYNHLANRGPQWASGAGVHIFAGYGTDTVHYVATKYAVQPNRSPAM
ncbi:MAG: hypothetical protein ACYC6G_19035 [Desulfobaccales bacterium]